MKSRKMLLLIALLSLALILLAAGGSHLQNAWGSLTIPGSPTAPATASEEPAAKTSVNQVAIPMVETSHASPEAPYTTTQWVEMPECANQPLGAEQLGLRAGQDVSAVAPGLSLQGVKGAEVSPEVTALALNIATGRLNRATGVKIEAMPDINTVGDLLDRIESVQVQPEDAAKLTEAARLVQSGEAITRPVCARMVVTNAKNQPEQVLWAGGGMEAQALLPQAAALAAPGEQSGLASAASPPTVMDTGKTSPNGEWAAFTSIGWDAGGPIFLQNFISGEWINLIERMNRNLTENQLPEDAWWDVIGWFPDSQRIMISPADASSAYIVSLADGSFQVIGLPTGGEGGGRVMNLTQDGSRLVVIALGEGDMQALTLYDIAAGESRALLNVPMHEGILHYPRFSPDGQMIAFVQQKGHPLTGVTEAIWLISVDTGSATKLIEGGLGLSVPTWSPDGKYLAFTRKDADQPDMAVQGIAQQSQPSNIWVAAVPDGKTWQVTYVDGLARSPAWAADSATIGYVTHEGKVGMVNIYQPGRSWLAAETSSQLPLYTSVFFVP